MKSTRSNWNRIEKPISLMRFSCVQDYTCMRTFLEFETFTHILKDSRFTVQTYRNVSNPVSLSRRNIIVVGSGETGLDIAQQALEAGGNVSVSTRSGWLSVPKQLPNGVPLDIYITNMFEASFEHRWVDRSRLKWIVATFFIRLFFFLGTYFSL